MKKIFRHRVLLSWLLILVFVLSGAADIPAYAASGVPAYDCKKSDSNLMKLMKKYDKDAYYILKKQKAKGDSFTRWMTNGDYLADVVCTSVHEEFHGYVWSYGQFGFNGLKYAFYVGGNKTIMVPKTKVFTTDKATRHIPKKYQTFRYKTYVGKGSNLSSNVDGVYGMLNEFSAYYWGMHASLSLYPYIDKHATSGMDWKSYINDYQNNKNAYAEFYYFTLVYLEYARKNEPEIYKTIINNKDYMVAMNTMETKFRKLIKTGEKNLDKICMKYNGASFKDSQRNGIVWFGNRGFGVSDDYSILIKQINSKKYKKVRNEIKKRGKK